MDKNLITPSKKFKSKRRKTKIRKKIIDISFGLVNSLCDLVLLSLMFGGEFVAVGGLHGRAAYRFKRAVRVYHGVDSKQWFEAFRGIKKRHWVDGSGFLTKEGKERLKSVLPKLYTQKNWDGNWHIVNFDIPEKYLRRKRNILREKLKSLGFGMLQQSIWISPFNFLGTVQKEVEELELGDFVLCSQTKYLGEEDSNRLAERVWKLSDINRQYEYFISRYERGLMKGQFLKMFFEFMSIFQNDPQLPAQLLPKNWLGEEARELLQDFYIKIGGDQKYIKSIFVKENL